MYNPAMPGAPSYAQPSAVPQQHQQHLGYPPGAAYTPSQTAAYKQPQPPPHNLQQPQYAAQPDGYPQPQPAPVYAQQQDFSRGQPQPQPQPRPRTPQEAPMSPGESRSNTATPTSVKSTGKARPRPSGANRIDPSQVPTPSRDLPQEPENPPRICFVTSKGIPPVTSTNFIVQDDGNASPKFLRPTVHAAPHTARFLSDSGLPWGIVTSPLFDLLEETEHPPLIPRQPIRCKRCRAYISPVCKFGELGRSWNCVFCEINNEVSPEDFCNLDSSGRRRDIKDKPEFSLGSVEYEVDRLPDYSLKTDDGRAVETQPLHHLFAFDVSQGARESLQDVVQCARQSIRSMAQKYPRCLVSFITYGSTLHFYDFKNADMPQFIVGDVHNPFVPIPFSLHCWMSVSQDDEKIEAFLDRIEIIHTNANEASCAVGAAAAVCSMILSECGGKVILTASNPPEIGIGSIQLRPQQTLYGTDGEKTLLQPINGWWPQLAVQCAKKQISFDLMLFPTGYAELVTLGQLCHVTNGIQSLFENYDSTQDRLRLQVAFERSLTQTCGYAGILRVRTSPGLRVKQYHGHFLSTNPHDMDLAAIHGSSTFYVELEHENNIDPKGSTYVQAALLYTTRDGSRRIRVHTLKTPVCNTFSALFRNSDLEGCLCSWIHDCCRVAVNKGPKTARPHSTDRLLKMLIAYRQYCSSGSHSGQLLLPETLKLLPVYLLAFTKSDALIAGTEVRIDARVQCIFDLLTMPLPRVLAYVYPRMFALHNLLQHTHAGTVSAITGYAVLPSCCQVQLTSDSVMQHGIYALHDQQAKSVFMWIGSCVNPRIMQQLFGVDDPHAIGATPFENWNDRLRTVLLHLMQHENGMDRLILVYEKDPAEEALYHNMIEDDCPGMHSYSEMLCALHKQINQKLYS